MRFFLMSQGSFNPNIRFLGQKVCPVACLQTDRHTDRMTSEGTLSGIQDFFLQPIIKDRPNNTKNTTAEQTLSFDKVTHADYNNTITLVLAHQTTKVVVTLTLNRPYVIFEI